MDKNKKRKREKDEAEAERQRQAKRTHVNDSDTKKLNESKEKSFEGLFLPPCIRQTLRLPYVAEVDEIRIRADAVSLFVSIGYTGELLSVLFSLPVYVIMDPNLVIGGHPVSQFEEIDSFEDTWSSIFRACRGDIGMAIYILVMTIIRFRRNLECIKDSMILDYWNDAVEYITGQEPVPDESKGSADK